MKWLKDKLAALWANAWFKGLVRAIEGGIIGVLADGAFEPSALFTRAGLKHAAALAATGAIIAVRNYLKQSPLQISGQ